MSQLTRKTYIALKKEASYGVAETLAAANCFQISNPNLTPLDGQTVSRDFVRPWLGNSSMAQVEAFRRLSFDIELQSSGAAGSAPAFNDGLLACGLAATISAGVSVAYSPVSDTFDSATIDPVIDHMKHQMLGARGSVALNIARRALPKLSFNFLGQYVAPTKVVTPLVPDWSAWLAALGANSVNTPTITLMGEAVCMESLSIDLANNLVYRDLPGCAPKAEITDRAPTGTIVFEMVDPDVYDWIEAARLKTAGALQIVHGTAAGKIVQIDAPVVTLGAPSYSDSEGKNMVSFPLTFEPDTGNDELVLTFK